MTPSLSSTLRARKEAAFRLRISEGSGRRWLWAAGCALPGLGLPLLVWHGRRHRTFIPFLYGLTTQAIGAFLLATVASFIPPAIPFVMVLRVTASSEPIAAWQVALSIVWGFAWVAVFMWAGAKIFRVGVLMQGKPPTPKELLKWVRMA